MKIRFTSVLLFFGILLGFGLSAKAQDFEVKDYEVSVRIDKEGFFDVEENYDVFFFSQRHGIYRDIILNYNVLGADGKEERREISLSNIDVPNHKFDADGEFARRLFGTAQIKIGDANIFVEGDVNYQINYRVKKAFLHNKEAIQFYWNLKPTGWFADFKDMSFRVQLPEGVRINENNVFVYSGFFGNSAESEAFEITISGNEIIGKALPGFNSSYGEAVTLLINLPPGSVKEIKPFWPFWSDYGWFILIMAIVLIFYLIWRRHGKEDHTPMVISYFPPKKIDPAMAGFLINDKQDSMDLISLIPYWGSQGLIQINEIDSGGWFSKKDTEIVKLKELPAKPLPSYERLFFEELFDGKSSVKISDLKDSFYRKMNDCKSMLKKEAQVYYLEKSRKVQGLVGFGLVLTILFIGFAFLFFWGFFAALALLLTSIILLLFNFYMSKKNPKGNEIFSELKGFRQFIRTAEENRIKMLIRESPNYFEDTMSYALAFGSLERWSDKFDALGERPPEWYHTPHGSYGSMNNFSKSFSRSMSNTQSNMVSQPSSSGSSGGGSSGGGFGGGGGGSW
ncbi:DUF2207 domain-containing protein [Algoriphagus sediminis]|uniref:DUF2207 domain-containing protein n=1 Tax=Algoriphagus sediminis TaxID=3057113 RepID=UPI0025B11782|nr:DUF2207 domain-containing protein [Algoriphagus sediminis]